MPIVLTIIPKPKRKQSGATDGSPHTHSTTFPPLVGAGETNEMKLPGPPAQRACCLHSVVGNQH